MTSSYRLTLEVTERAIDQQHVEAVQGRLIEHGYKVDMPYGLETIGIKRRTCADIGNVHLCAMNVLDIVDIDGYIEQGVTFCFPQRGSIWFLPKQEANGAPVDQRTYPPQALQYSVSGNYTCARVPRAGYMALVAGGHTPSGGGGGGTVTRPTCERLDAELRAGVRARNATNGNLNIRDRANGQRLAKLGAGQVVEVLEGPVNAGGYYWFKIRHGTITGWAAESGNCKYWLEQTSESVSNPTTRRSGEPIIVDGRCELEDAIEAANRDRVVGGCLGGRRGSDTIRLDSSVTLKRKLPAIESTIIINGSSRTISGENRYQIFEVAGGAVLTLRDLTLRNGKTDRQGGAIVNNGALTITNSTIRNNTADKDGGAISNSGTMTVSNSAFRNNTAGESGGAIRNKGSLIVRSNRFENNQAGESGGAIRNKGSLTASNNRFTSNRGEAGGAIDHDGDSIRLSGNTFSNNSPDNCRGVDCGDVPGLDPDELSIEIGGSLTGELEEGEEYHSIQLRLLDSATISVRMIAASGDLVPGLKLWDNDATKLEDDENDNGLNIAEMEDIELEPGLYWIDAWSVRGGGRYELEVSGDGLPDVEAQVVAPAVPELDPNMPSIAIGAELEGVLTDSDDVHNVQLRLTEPATVSVSMTTLFGDLVPGLTLFEDGDTIAEDNNDDGDSVARLDEVELEPGLYVLSRWSARGSGAYSLKVVSGKLSFAIAYGRTAQGTLYGSDIFHLYDFEGKAGDIIDIDMNATGGSITPMFSLWNDSGDKLKEDSNSARRRDAVIEGYSLPQNGVYTISVNNQLDGEGTYKLTLSQADLRDPGTRDIAYNERKRGRLHDNNSTDDFVFDAEAGDTISIHVDSLGFLVPSVELIPPSGEGMSQNAVPGIYSAIDTDDITLEKNGKYTIRVGRSAGLWGRYALELKWKTFIDPDTKQKLADMDTHWSNDQLAMAAGQMKNELLKICDVTVTVGAGAAATAAAAGTKVVAEKVLQDILLDVAEHIAKEGVEAAADWVEGFIVEKTADMAIESWQVNLLILALEEMVHQVGLEEEVDDAKKITELFLEKAQQIIVLVNTLLESAPTGVCTGVQFVVEFSELKQDIEEKIKELLDFTGTVGACRIFAEHPLPGRNWPSPEAKVVRKLYAADGLVPHAVYRDKNGDKYYAILGKTGSDAPIIGLYYSVIAGFPSLIFNVFDDFKESRHYGLVFVRDDLVGKKGNCAALHDETESLQLFNKPGPGEPLNPWVLKANHKIPAECNIVIFGAGIYQLFDNWHTVGGSTNHEDPHGTTNIPHHYRIMEVTIETAKLEPIEQAADESSGPSGRGWIHFDSVDKVYSLGNLPSCSHGMPWAYDIKRGEGLFPTAPSVPPLDPDSSAEDQPDEPDDPTTDEPSDRPDSDPDMSAVDEPDEPDDPATDEPSDRPDSDPDRSAVDEPDEPDDPASDPPSVPPLDPYKPSIGIGDIQVGNLPAGNDYDEYQLRLLSDATVTIRMSGCMRPGLSLHRDDGNKAVKDQQSRGGSNTAEFTNVDLGPGLYTISAWTVSGGGNYKLEVFSESRAKTSFAAPDADKPIIGFGSRHKDSLPEGRDYDTIQLCLLSPANGISIRMSTNSGDLVPGLTLYDNVDNPEDRAESQFGVAELTNINLAPGVYHISAWSVSGGGDYTLAVN